MKNARTKIFLGILGLSFLCPLASAQGGDEIFGGQPTLCGRPVLEPKLSSKLQFRLANESDNWIVATDARTFEYLTRYLETSRHPNLCAPTAGETATAEPIFIEWFAIWDIAGSGISVSNQISSDDK